MLFTSAHYVDELFPNTFGAMVPFAYLQMIYATTTMRSMALGLMLLSAVALLVIATNTRAPSGMR